jgi:predicted permease
MVKKQPVALALAWLVPVAGAGIFVTLQSFSFLNDYVRSGGTLKSITFGPGALLAIALFYGAWVLPPLLALAGKRGTDWAMLVLGGTLVLLNTLGGVTDGLRDGGHLVVLELLAVTLPGAVALILSWRHLRAN